MYRLWDSIMQPIVDTIDAHHIVEIGLYEGALTARILAYAEARAIKVTGVDIAITPQITALKDEYGDRLHIIEDMSLNALPRLDAPDVIIIDGDHNWYTVFNELKLIALQSVTWKKFPLIFLHDTGWPFARRDMYHNPETIPAAYRQAYGTGGLITTQGMLGTDDEGLIPGVAKAIYENPLQNGVLTAIEDFLKERNDLQFIQVPGFYGIGILAPQHLTAAYPRLLQKLNELTISPFICTHIEQLENERIHLLLQLRKEQRTLEEKNVILHDTYALHDAERTRLVRELEQEKMRLTLQWETEREQMRGERKAADELHRQEHDADLKKMGAMHEAHINEMRAARWLHDKETAALKREHALQTDMHRNVVENLRTQYNADKDAYEEKLRHSLETAEARFTAENQLLKEWIFYLEQSRSWRWTAPLRAIHLRPPVLRASSVINGLFGSMRRMWEAIGMPFPRAIRYVRHRLFGRIRPVKNPEDKTPPDAPPGLSADIPLPPVEPNTPAPVYMRSEMTSEIAVIIPCHNYGRYLNDAIESVLRQTLRPQDIVVVDDASEDDTRAVAESYADRGVRYIRGDWKSVGMARNAGLRDTTSLYLVFLDADNLLHPDYLRCCFEALKQHPEAAIAYGDQQSFGNRSDLYEFPDAFHWTLFDRQNHMDSISMVRRDALLQAGGWSHGIGHDGDWITWRRILSLGWKAVKSDGMYFYRIHDSNMIFDLQQTKTYAERGGFFEEPATLFLSLSGRGWAWPMTREFLETQTFPHHLLHLVVTDTSGDTEFGSMIKQWLHSCDYRGFTYLHDPVFTPGLADLPREENTAEVSHACARIYNTFAQHCQTTLALFLEDDIVPPPDAFVRLINHFDSEILSVGAAYHSRIHNLPVGWKMPGVDYESMDDHPKSGVSEVFGSGFGCTVMRGSYLRQMVFRSPAGLSFDYDFFARAHEPLKLRYPNSDREFEHPTGWRTLVDWDCVCKHYSNSHTWV